MALAARLSPYRISLVAAVAIGSLLAALLWLALGLPATGLDFDARDDRLLVRAAPGGAWQEVVALRRADGRELPMPAMLAVEEPDFLPGWRDANALFAAQQPLLEALGAGGASLLLAGGGELPVSLRERRLADLPWNLWAQLAFGLVALVVASAAWSFRPMTRETGLLLVTAAGFAAGTWSAAVYSSRELLMPGTLFHALSLANHGGALLFDCAMAALLWVYPRPLGPQPVVRLLAAAFLLLWLADSLQLVDSFSRGFYLWLLLVYLLAAAFALRQWQVADRDPLARAALRWLLLSFLLGSGAFVLLQILPRVLQLDAPLPQSAVSGAFLILYLGLAAGIGRHRLFHLERWWRTAWSWLLGGVLVLLVDGLLAWLLHIEQWASLALAIAVAGWIYFPLRQWLLARTFSGDRREPSLRPQAVRRLFDLASRNELAAHWPQLLAQMFQPLQVEELPLDGESRIEEHGLHLLVPGLVPGTGHRLACCERGARLFRPADVRLAEDLRGIALHAQATVAARREGARLERARIKRDLHDDLGARLLSVLHGQDVQDMREEARLAIQDLRQMLATLDERRVEWPEAADLLASEARERLARDGVAFAADIDASDTLSLSARHFANIRRIVREAVTNVLRHARARHVSLRMQLADGVLVARVADDGHFDPALLERSGRGHLIIHSRVQELGGTVRWERNDDGGCTLVFVMPLAPAAGTSPDGGDAGPAR